jgi:hypothetical protein
LITATFASMRSAVSWATMTAPGSRSLRAELLFTDEEGRDRLFGAGLLAPQVQAQGDTTQRQERCQGARQQGPAPHASSTAAAPASAKLMAGTKARRGARYGSRQHLQSALHDRDDGHLPGV